MKKFIMSFILAASLLHITASAENLTSDIKYVKTEDTYENGLVTIAKDRRSGEIVPISYESLGYCYAYMPDGGEFETISVAAPVFEDYTDPFYVSEMAARGVLDGFEDGTFRSDTILTRSQMAAVFSRLFRIEPSNKASGFSDVPYDSWYAGYVSALSEIGIFSEADLFNPDSPVTREQLTAMTYRMLSYIGALDTSLTADLSQYKDMSSVSDYAAGAYNSLTANGYFVVYDLEDNNYEDTADDEYYLIPQAGVTRGECAESMYNIAREIIEYNAPAIKRENAPDIDIPTLDGSTSTYEITRNIYWQYYLNYQNHPDFPKSHSKTSNSYKRLIDGEVDMIFVPDPSEDIRSYAEEKGVTLKYIPIANEALVFFTSDKNTVQSISTEQLHDIYVNNGIDNWSDAGGPDAELVPFCRNNDSGSHAQMEKFILNGGEINNEIEKEHISLMMASILTDVDEFNRENPGKYALGYSLYYYYQNVQYVIGPCDLKLLSIDGVPPTDDTIGDGTYPYTTNYYAVIRDENDPDIEAFAELMQGEFGDKVIDASGMGVIK